MKKRIIALVAVITLLMAFFAGCGGTGDNPGGDKDKTPVNEAQLVIAMNPLLLFNGTDTVVAYNDLQKAMTTDSQGSSLAGLSQSGWQWRTQKDSGAWMQRATYNWGKWTSGTGAQVKGVFAYSFNDAGNQSLGVYSAKNAQLVPYGEDQADAAGILVSVTGNQEEALTYTVAQDGDLIIPGGLLTAISEVNGVKTGFLAEDGTARSASVRLVVNDTQLYSGTLSNTTAATDGVAVTQLTYPQLEGLKVKAGDVVSFCFKLNAQANTDKDVTIPQEGDEDGWVVTKKSELVKVEPSEEDKLSQVVTNDGSIRMIMNFDFTFTLVRDAEKYATRVSRMAHELENVMEAEIPVAKPGDDPVPYEIIIGAYAGRPRSVELTKELQTFRADNVLDWRIKLEGTKLYIVGANDEALELAIQEFMTLFGSSDKATIPANYDNLHRPAHFPVTVAGQNIGSYVIRTERYPSLIIRQAAEAIQNYVLNTCGFRMEIRPLNIAGTDHVANELRIGPMNGSVQVQREYDTFFKKDTEKSVGKLSIDADGYLNTDPGYYTARFEGKNLIVEGGTDYAVNVAVARIMKVLEKNRKLDATYKDSGTYKSYFDYFNQVEDVEGVDAGRETMKYEMVNGYALALTDDFSDTGATDQDVEKSVKSRWTVDQDESKGCDEEKERQFRPGIYGENWWITQDGEGNGYLMEITKRATRESTVIRDPSNNPVVMPGYDAVRLSSRQKFGWRFGISETRIVMGCRNGACSGVWYASDQPVSSPNYSNEFDVYENYGRELLVPNSYANFTNTNPPTTTMATEHGQTLGWVTPNAGEHFYDTFHHITMEWSYDMVHYYLDGVSYCEIPLNDAVKHLPLRQGTTWRLANGIGSGAYTTLLPDMSHDYKTFYNPADWMGANNVDKFFEVQVVDYIRLYQTTNDGKTKVEENQLTIVPGYNLVNRPKAN